MPTTHHAAVYAGQGSSHSWTWLADLFEGSGMLGARFLSAKEFVSALKGPRIRTAIVSGGDGYAIAEALSGDGFRGLERWISDGGTYVGMCAGAYLPLRSSIPPFSEFNLSSTKIENILCGPEPKAEPDPRREVRYGTCSIVHPVRGPVEMANRTRGKVLAPLYGGPVFKEPETDTVLLRYSAFTDETEFQTDRDDASRMMLGKPAAVASVHGSGNMMLFGPHLEHPRFPEANKALLGLLGWHGASARVVPAIPSDRREMQQELHGAISDLKVAIYGLENRSFVVGHKAWDGSRYLELVSALEKRTWTLTDREASGLASALTEVRDGLVAAKAGPEYEAEGLTRVLVEATRGCVDSHFMALARDAEKASGTLFPTEG